MSSPAGPLVVACAADRAYALPLAVMLRSLAANLDPALPLEVFAVDDGLEAGDRERVASALGERGTLHWRPPGRRDRAALPAWGRMPATTYEKLWVAELLPAGVERAIWLDCDLLVLADLAPLWREPFDGPLALAVEDALVPTVASRFGVAAHRQLGLAPETPYFNAGVLVIDVARWRSERIAERAAEYLERFRRDVAFWDQEALNAVLAGRWRPLDRRWNLNPVLDRLFPPAADPRSGGGAWIVHFSGSLKPWRVRGLSPYEEVFFARLDETPWRGWRPRRSWRGRLLSRLASSRLRAALYPLEQRWTSVRRRLTRRRTHG